MKRLSERVIGISESETLAVAARVRKLRECGLDIVDLSLGEPDFPTPEYICEAAKQAIDSRLYFSYPPVAGYLDLRRAIASKFNTQNNINYTHEQIVVSNGAKQAIVNVLLALLDPGDEVIVFSPHWVSYESLIRITGATPVFVKANAESGFKVSKEQLGKAVSRRTKLILFSSPGNPTGAVYSRDELEGIAEVVRSNEGITVISDEIYEFIEYSGSHASIASLPGMADRTVTVNGFSKLHAMTGWRVGYMGAPQWIADAATRIQGQMTSANSSISQRAAYEAISGGPDRSLYMVEEYRRRRDLVYEHLCRLPGIKTGLPQGAFYFFPDIKDYFGTRCNEYVINDAQGLCDYLLNHSGVAVIPGDPFGDKNCIRIAYTRPERQLEDGLNRIKKSLALLQ
ncbi:MAG: pyridoxal phosphate-dependent aminotransferase [Burkholderiales bacterium]|nr:pyridoxal phosphate-dependent aminotransferase [Burkholderiales bacterium]